jgi:hypothetical protein
MAKHIEFLHLLNRRFEVNLHPYAADVSRGGEQEV